VKDVRVLVREDQLEPVGRIADERRDGGRGRRHLDGVVGNGRRPAVGEVALIDQDHLHPPARNPERRLRARADALGDRRDAPRQRLLALVRVNVEVCGADGAETEPRVVALGAPRRPRPGRDRRGDREQAGGAAATARASAGHLSRK
jgi:hypothetical protein